MGKYPNEQEQETLLNRADTPEPVRAHCRAVAERAAELASRSPEPVDLELLECACLLHDLCRAEGREHPQRAAEVLAGAGYQELAEIVRQHHDLGSAPSPEAQILYLSDKLTAGTEPVSLKERFEAAWVKCSGPKAFATWRRRYDEARTLAVKFGWEE